jgi:cyclase
MTRGTALGTVIGIGALSMVVATAQAPAGPSAAALAATKIEKVKNNLYIITGEVPGNAFSGGTTAVFVGTDGVVVVDTKLAGWGQVLLDRIKSVTDKPVTTIINTHTHGDHTGNNDAFGTTVDIVAQENTKANMMKMDAFKGEKAQYLPKVTFKTRMVLNSGSDEVDLYYFGRGHTNGDAWVVFPALRTLEIGDLFAWKDLPLADTMNGGSAYEFPQTLSKGLATLKNIDTVIGGHQGPTTRQALQEYANFNKDFVAWAVREMKAGKTVDQAAAEYKTPAKYKGYQEPPGTTVGPPGQRLKANIQNIYDEAKR